MTEPDSATPRPAARASRAPSRLTYMAVVAALVAAAIIVGVALLFLSQLRATAPRVTAVVQHVPSAPERNRTDRVARNLIAPGPQMSVPDLDRRISALEGDVPSAELRQRIADLSAAQLALDARIGKLERAEPALTMRRAAAELALANLVRASGGGDAFFVELQTFRALMPDAPEVADLAPIAQRGAPTRGDLAARFDAVAEQALVAEGRAHAKNWLGRLWSNLTSIIVVRRIGDRTGNDSESILARASAKLQRGDLAGTVAELQTLTGAAGSATRPFLNDVKARLRTERDTAALADRLAKLLATP